MDGTDGTGTIVVGYDGSPGSSQALDWAAETAKDLGTKLLIVHAVNLAMIPGFSMFEGQEYHSTLEDAAEAVLDEGRAQASRHLDDAAIGQLVPKGPRSPSTVPGSPAQIACVTAPTDRTVRTTGPGRPGGPLTEIGTSPIPNA